MNSFTVIEKTNTKGSFNNDVTLILTHFDPLSPLSLGVAKFNRPSTHDQGRSEVAAVSNSLLLQKPVVASKLLLYYYLLFYMGSSNFNRLIIDMFMIVYMQQGRAEVGGCVGCHKVGLTIVAWW